MNDESTWDVNRIRTPMLNKSASALSYHHFNILDRWNTWLCALLQVAKITPAVRTPTAKICLGVYLLPTNNHPIVIVTNVPPLLKMMYTGILTWYPSAALFKVLVTKKSVTIIVQRKSGICLCLRKKDVEENVKCQGRPSNATPRNWKKVIVRPVS